MSGRKKKLPIFQGLCTNTDFVKRERALAKILLTGKQNKSNVFLKIGWLYDQWALISSIEQREIYQRKAIKYFRLALHNGAERWIVFNGLGTVNLHQGNLKEALQFYRKLHRIHKSSISYNALGNVYRQLKRFIIAKRNYEYALKESGSGEEQSATLYNLIQLERQMSSANNLNKKLAAKNYMIKLQRLVEKFPIAKILFTRTLCGKADSRDASPS